MPDTIGNIVVPEIAASGTFPIVPDYPFGRASQPDVAIHQFGSGNAKIEQRFLLGTGAKRFTVHKTALRYSDRVALRDFWETKYGPYGAFTYNAPNDDGVGTTAYTCRFANEPLSWEMIADWTCTVGVTLIEIRTSAPTYAVNAVLRRFPSEALASALLSQVQEVIPLATIQPLAPGYPALYLSDRRCTIGGQLYQARLLEFDGISQSMSGESDNASFTFGNADRVLRDLANDVDLFRASIEFSLFHVATGTKLDLWKGDVVNWSLDAGPEFKLSAADGLYELNLPYPCRKISRSCWKPFNDDLTCPFRNNGAMDLVHFPSADPTKCDKGYDTPNGCLAHGMKHSYGAVVVEPQGVRVKDNSTGTWGFGRSSITSVSLVSESIYDEVVPEVYTDSDMPVNCKIAAGRDESDFYEAMGIVGEGPIGALTVPHMADKDGDGKQETFVGHTLDGQPNHGFKSDGSGNNYGLRTSRGTDPAGTTDYFSLDQGGNQTGGDWRKVFNGADTFKDNFAAGTAFVVIRRTDAKGLQLSNIGEHQIQAMVAQGLSGWVWSSAGHCSLQLLTNPVWIAVNMLLRARGLRFADAATAAAVGEQFFDVDAAIAAANVCALSVPKLVGSGNETQFKFRGTLQEEKPLRDWLQEVLMNCLGYYTFAFGKLKLGVRSNSSTVEAFTEGNILFRSLQLAPLKPSFNHLTANFADEEFQFANNSVTVYDIDHATLLGGTRPMFVKSTANLSGTASKSQAGRIVSVRLREELGGIDATEWKKARQVAFRTTVLALATEPGMVCSMTHPDMPGGIGEFRVVSWKLNKDYSIDIQGRTTTDSMYDLIRGPKPADVEASPVPTEAEYPVPDDIQPIGADAFLFTKTEDGLNSNYALEYDPPSHITNFQGVTLHVESPLASRKVIFTQDYDYNGVPDALDATRHGTCKFSLPQTLDPYDIRMYLAARSRVYKKPLVFADAAVPTPNRTDTVSAGATLGEPGDAPNVNPGTTATAWYKYVPGSAGNGWVFGFEGNVVAPADVSNFRGCEIYLHWIEGWANGQPIYDQRYLWIERAGKDGGAWHANEPGFPLDQPNWSQQVDVVFVPKNRFGTENLDKSACFTVRVTVQSEGHGDGTQPEVPQNSTAQVDYEYRDGKGWFFGFSGLVADPADKTNYHGTKVYLHWDGDDRYLEVWDTSVSGLAWRSDRWTLADNFRQGISIVFVSVDLNGRGRAWEDCPSVALVVESQADRPANVPSGSTAQVDYEWRAEESIWYFGFSGTITEPVDKTDYASTKVFLHWDGDDRYLEVWDSKGGLNWKSDHWTLRQNFSQGLRVFFVPVNKLGQLRAWEDSPSVSLLVSSGNAGSAPAAPNAACFKIGNAGADGQIAAAPKWDTLNERMVFDWGCVLPGDVTNLGDVAIFIRLPSGKWVQAPASEWSTPTPGAALFDSFAVGGQDVPKVPEDWTFVACSANKEGTWNHDAQGNPTGPSVTLRTIVPNGGVGAGNLGSNLFGNGLFNTGNQVVARTGQGVEFDAQGNLKTKVLQNGLGYDAQGRMYVLLNGQGLGFDFNGYLQVPNYAIGQYLLANSPIIDSYRLCSYAVSQMHLQNAQIIDAARICDLAVTNYKLGYGCVEGINIGAAVIEDAHIAEVSFNKMIAGNAIFTGDVTFSNTGALNMYGGGGIRCTPGQVSATGFNTCGVYNNWDIMCGSDPGIRPANPYVFTTYMAAQLFRYYRGVDGGGNPLYYDGVSQAVTFKDGNGNNATMYFNGGIRTA